MEKCHRCDQPSVVTLVSDYESEPDVHFCMTHLYEYDAIAAEFGDKLHGHEPKALN